LDPSWDPLERVLRETSTADNGAVVVAGRVVVEDGRVNTVDEAALWERMRAIAAAADPAAVAERRGLTAELMPAIDRFYEAWDAEDTGIPFYRLNAR
jgi:hypothetical protein